MEDRITTGLYLEMTDHPVEDYAGSRVPQVLRGHDAERATWWENVYRDRPDLPRRLPEFSHLGLYEVGPRFAPPETPDGITGHHFRHSRRPGQGRLTGKPTIGLSLVLVSPRAPASAQELRDWGDFVHIRHIAEVGVPGYSMITPYENVTGGEPTFLHCYEMDTDDPESAFASMTPRVERLLGSGSAAFAAWARGPLHIDYVNTFRRLGERVG